MSSCSHSYTDRTRQDVSAQNRYSLLIGGYATSQVADTKKVLVERMVHRASQVAQLNCCSSRGLHRQMVNSNTCDYFWLFTHHTSIFGKTSVNNKAHQQQQQLQITGSHNRPS